MIRAVDVIRIERGAPTAEELAALVTVLLLARRPVAPAALSRWARSARRGRRPGWR